MIDAVFDVIKGVTVSIGAVAVWYYFWWHGANRRSARRDIRIIRRGLRAYVERYGRLPVVTDDDDEQDAAKLLEVLCGSKWKVGKAYYPRTVQVAELNPDCVNFVRE